LPAVPDVPMVNAANAISSTPSTGVALSGSVIDAMIV
jgi:hypothetical protein